MNVAYNAASLNSSLAEGPGRTLDRRKQFEDWEWSSARWYAGLRPVKLEMDEGVLTELARG
jgi:hypothetical protein